MLHKFQAAALAAILSVSMVPASAFAASPLEAASAPAMSLQAQSVQLTLGEGPIEIAQSGTYELTGAGGGPVTVTGDIDVTLVLGGVEIDARGAGASGIGIVGGARVTLAVSGANSVTGDVNYAGVQVDEASSLTIEGSDSACSLIAVGNGGVDYADPSAQAAAGSSCGAGIGGTKAAPSAGAIGVNGHDGNLTISAIGGGAGAAGIGSAYGGGASAITISQTTLSTVHGGCVGAAKQENDAYQKSGVEGGPAIGGGTKGAAGGTVVIRDCTGSDIVGGAKSAGIGGGCWAHDSRVEIYDSELEVEGGLTGAAIGTGRVSTGLASDVLIAGSTITARGGYYGAGIGVGINASNDKLGVSNVVIRNSDVEATGGAGAAAIGGGVRGYNVNVAIEEGSNVEAYAGANYLAKYTTLYNGSPDTMGGVGIGQSGAAAIGRGAWGSVTKFADYEAEAQPKIAVSADSSVVAMSSGDNWAVAGFTDAAGVAATLLQTRFDRNYDLQGSDIASQSTNPFTSACYLDGAAATNLVVRDAETLQAVTTISAPAVGEDFANGYEGSGRVGYYSFAVTVPGPGTYKIGTSDNVRTAVVNGDESIASDDARYLGGAEYVSGEVELARYVCPDPGITSYDRVFFDAQADSDPIDEDEGGEDEGEGDGDEGGESGEPSDGGEGEPAKPSPTVKPESDPSSPTGSDTGSGSSASSEKRPSAGGSAGSSSKSGSDSASSSKSGSSSKDSLPKTGDPIAAAPLVLSAVAATATLALFLRSRRLQKATTPLATADNSNATRRRCGKQ